MARITSNLPDRGTRRSGRVGVLLSGSMRVAALLLAVLAISDLAHGQSLSSSSAPSSPVDASFFTPTEPARALKTGKVLHARRIVGEPPTIDGRLNEEMWAAADAVGDLTQRDPDNGRSMSEATRVQVAYDDRFLYVAVTCVDTQAHS